MTAAEPGASGAMDEVFRALADSSRRHLLDRLHDEPGQTLRELCGGLDMSRQAVSKHLALLEAANVVTAIRHGREKLHYLNPAPIADIGDRWISRYDTQRVAALSNLKRALEDSVLSDKPQFVYTTYIHATPEQVWQGLTDPAFTKQYWRHPVTGGLSFPTDWRKGSTYDLAYDEAGFVISDPEQVILESDPYRRLSYAWHTFTPEWATGHGIDDATAAAWRAEPRSKVGFDIEDTGRGVVKLTVVHDGFESDSSVLQGITQGWPAVLASLKTLLETGSALGMP